MHVTIYMLEKKCTVIIKWIIQFIGRSGIEELLVIIN